MSVFNKSSSSFDKVIMFQATWLAQRRCSTNFYSNMNKRMLLEKEHLVLTTHLRRHGVCFSITNCSSSGFVLECRDIFRICKEIVLGNFPCRDWGRKNWFVFLFLFYFAYLFLRNHTASILFSGNCRMVFEWMFFKICITFSHSWFPVDVTLEMRSSQHFFTSSTSLFPYNNRIKSPKELDVELEILTFITKCVRILLRSFLIIVTLISVIILPSYLPTLISTFCFFLTAHSYNKTILCSVFNTYFICFDSYCSFLSTRVWKFIQGKEWHMWHLSFFFSNLQLPTFSVAFFITNFSAYILTFLYFFLQVITISFLLGTS